MVALAALLGPHVVQAITVLLLLVRSVLVPIAVLLDILSNVENSAALRDLRVVTVFVSMEVVVIIHAVAGAVLLGRCVVMVFAMILALYVVATLPAILANYAVAIIVVVVIKHVAMEDVVVLELYVVKDTVVLLVKHAVAAITVIMVTHAVGDNVELCAVTEAAVTLEKHVVENIAVTLVLLSVASKMENISALLHEGKNTYGHHSTSYSLTACWHLRALRPGEAR